MNRLLKFLLMPFVFYVDEPSGGGGDGGGQKPNPKPDPETFSREYVVELRHENASYRTKAQEAATKAAEADARAVKATEEAEGKVTAAQQVANDRIIRAELKAAAIKAGMVDLDGLKLADLSKVKLNDAGEVEGAEALMEEMKKSKAYLFDTKTSSTNTDTKPPKPADGEPKKATEMTDAEYAKARSNIKRGLVPKAV